MRECHRRPRLKNLALKRQVESWIKKKWSPEIISGRLARNCGRKIIGHEAIYQWIYTEAPHLIRHLPRKHLFRGFRRINRANSMIPGRVHVSRRSQKANLHLEPGHWEVDLIVSRKGKAALKVAVERKTRFTRLFKVHNHSPHASFTALSHIFSSIPQPFRKSITYDNGFENALHRQINSKFNLQSFFCSPGHSWEKPTVENTNGLIRWFLPKRSNLDIIPHHKILAIESWLNSRPRKCLEFQTPLEAFNKISGALTP